MNLARIGEFWARWRPDELSIKYAGVETTWRELDVRTSNLAAGLAGKGIVKGDRIGLLLTNCMEWIELTMAAWKLGALIVPINTRFTPAEVKFLTANAGAKLLFTNDGLVDSTKTVEGCEVIRVEHIAPLYADGSTIVTADTAPDDAAFICYTSGTTGDPKGAVLTHGSFNAGSQSWAQALDLWPGDKLQLPFPLAFTGGLALWLYTYWSGASLLLDNEVNIDRIYDNFEKERAT
ncbi:MAG: class I adenylate-forming enzyme family protein, partial [Actinomycetota bacterium]